MIKSSVTLMLLSYIDDVEQLTGLAAGRLFSEGGDGYLGLSLLLFIVLFFIIRLFAVWRYAGRIFNAGICRGKAISEFRSPKAMPFR